MINRHHARIRFRRRRVRALRTLLLAATAGPFAGAVWTPSARAVTDLHFDYTSFDNPNSPGASPHFGQNQFNVLNYPSINGNYMMTSTDAHRPEMLANNNNLAEFYNFLEQRYEAHTTKDGNLSADEIDTYVGNNSAHNGDKPHWLILNEISTSLWQANAGPPSISTYRTWLLDCVTRLHDVYGYDVVTYSPFATVNTGTDSNAASWQALAAKSYIGIENYLSGPEVMAGGSDYASRVNWAKGQYNASKSTYTAAGVSFDKLFLGEDFGNTAAVDSKGRPVGYGRAGLASASDWDTVLQIRQDAIRAIGFPGFLAYAWGSNGMGITEAEQIQHEYYYRTRLVLPGQQPQWLTDAAINVNGTVIPLSWSQQLNWIGGVPDGVGAVANFYRTNTAARTLTLDGARTLGTLGFNSPFAYTISPGSGGSLTLNNGAAAASVTVAQGAHTIAAPLALAGPATFDIAGTLSLTGGLSNPSGKSLTRTGAGTLNLTGAQLHGAGAILNANGGVTNFNSDAGSASAANLTVNANATTNFNTSQHLSGLNIATNVTATLAAGGSRLISTAALATIGVARLDLKDNRLIVRDGAIGGWSAATSKYDGVTGQVAAGRAGGNWNGPGIVTTLPAAQGILTTLAVAKASDVFGISSAQTASWSGETVNGDAVLVGYTYGGDANLNGRIDADDYFHIDSGFLSGLRGYVNGDFDFNGIVNGDDYFVIDSNFADQGAPLDGAAAAAAESMAAQGASTGAVPVPEPAGGMLIISGIFLFARRRCGRGDSASTGARP
jgi:hypothetical protein